MGLLKMMRWSYYLEKFRLLIKRNWNSRNLCNLQKWRVCLINLINHLMSKRFVLMIWWGKISQPARSGSFKIRVDKRCVTMTLETLDQSDQTKLLDDDFICDFPMVCSMSSKNTRSEGWLIFPSVSYAKLKN